MNSGPGIFELNFNENNGVLAPVAAASTFTVPVELVPYAEACLPADGSLQNLYLNLIPKIGAYAIIARSIHVVIIHTYFLI